MPRMKRQRVAEHPQDSEVPSSEVLVDSDVPNSHDVQEIQSEIVAQPSKLTTCHWHSPTPAAQACPIEAMTISPDETMLAISRSNGSVALWLLSQGKTSQLELLRSIGGRRHHTMRRLAWISLPLREDGSGGDVIVGACGSGQLAALDALSLNVVAVAQRKGGVVFDMVRAGPADVICAVGDGSWLHWSVVRTGELVEFVLRHLIPPISGCAHAIAVTVCGDTAIGAAHGGYLCAWRFNEPHKRLFETRATTRGHVVAVAALPSSVIACGCTTGEIVVVHQVSGSIIASLMTHKGPVTALVAAASSGTFYASGWHNSIRCLRATAEGQWYPAEVARRSHYHEIVALGHIRRTDTLVSCARDGTLMIAPCAKFPAIRHFVPAGPQQVKYAAGIIAVSRYLTSTASRRAPSSSVEIFQLRDTEVWVHRASIAIPGESYINRIWIFSTLGSITLIVTTDEFVIVLRSPMQNDEWRVVQHLPMAFVVDCALDETTGSLFIASPTDILRCPYDFQEQPEHFSAMKMYGIVSLNICPETRLLSVLWNNGRSMTSLHSDGKGSLTEKCSANETKSVDNVKCSRLLSRHRAPFMLATSNLLRDVQYSFVHSSTAEVVNIISLTRNLDSEVTNLPEQWYVRRFAN